MPMQRSDFLKGAFAFGAFAPVAGCRLFTGADCDYDESLAILVSDPHVKPGGYQLDRLRGAVAEILRMNPLPRNVVCFGDIARSFGRREDYEAGRGPWQDLVNAGIRVTLGMGNHDRRRNFLEVWPEYERRTLVKGRIVTVADIGACDILLLDSLFENHSDETRHCEGDGQLTGDQWDWLRAALPKWPRPVLVGAHHSVCEFRGGVGKELGDLLMDSRNVIGYVHGHNHLWDSALLSRSDCGWGNRTWKRSLSLPSVGHWGDIGYVVLRTSNGFACVELAMKDHYFPDPDIRTWIDDEIVKEKRGMKLTFKMKNECIRTWSES